MAADTDYAVYEGTVGDFTSHLPTLCSTGGATSATFTPQAGDRYYLVVPTSLNREGSYGDNSSAGARAASGAACHVQYLSACD